MVEKLFVFTWIVTDGLGCKTHGKDYFYTENIEQAKDNLDELLSDTVTTNSYCYETNEYGIRIKLPFAFGDYAPIADCGCNWKIGSIKQVSKKQTKAGK